MGSLENGAPPLPLSLTKRVPLLGPSSLRPHAHAHHHRPYRSKLARFLLFEKVDYFHLLCIAALFFSVVFLFGFFLPGSAPENHVRKLRESGDQAREIAVLGLDFGEGIRFEPVKLLQSWEKAKREAKECLNGLGRQVFRIGVRKPRLAMVFGDLLLDAMQLEMVSVGAALKEAGYEIEVFSMEDGPAGEAWRSLAIPVRNLSVTNGCYTSIDWLDFDGIFVNSLRARPILSSLSQEPFKSVPVVWTVHERHLAVRLNSYASNGLTLLINDWNRAFNRATVVVFPNYVLPLIYSPFDSGNFYVIPGSPAEVLRADAVLKNKNDVSMRQKYGFNPDDFIVSVVGSHFLYSGIMLEHAVVLKALAPLLKQFRSKNETHSRLKVRILSSNLTDAYKVAIEAAAHSAGFPDGVVGYISNFEEASLYVLSVSDVVIYGSFLEEQSFPSALIQAMSLKRLIIAPNLSMISKYIENGVNGYLYPKERVGIIPRIILKALSDGKLSLFSQRMASIGQNHVKNLMSCQSIEGYINLLENIVHFPSEAVKPNLREVPSNLKEQWQWHHFENLTSTFYIEEDSREEQILQKYEKEWLRTETEGHNSNLSYSRVDEVFVSIAWEEEKKIEMANIKRLLEEDELKQRTEQSHGTWEEVYRNAKKADRAKNELHERDDRELERTGQPLCIYEPYFGEGTWPFLHQTSLYRGIGMGTRGRRPGLDDIDASSRLPLLNDIYYRDLLGEYGAFFAIANRIDRIHKNAWIGFQSWRASAMKANLSRNAELAILEAIENQKHGDALYFWVRMDQDKRNPSRLDFWSFCDSLNAGNCRFAVANTLRRMYSIKQQEKDTLPPMPNSTDTWSVMQSWVLPTRSFLEFVMFSRMFVDALDADMYEEHHGTGHCYLSVHKDPHCYSRLLELLVNIWAYHSARRMVYVDPHTGSMHEVHQLTTRRHQMWVRWFSYQTLKDMDEDLAEEADSDQQSRRWLWPATGEVYWQGVLEREKNSRHQQKEKRKQQSKEKIERIKRRARQKALGKFIKPPPEEDLGVELNSTRTN
ncbi:UDP-Glycosyltransferase superfamily protein [Rhynchospora pubera]|uniref:UDP-Glycosyltransferase superfamily protein n=1 Tax=Rhynchospora pubera TaxID=906938 RepID=A0AAV8FWN8_9POAL|nr:UDP-Glycosyltransferase superfamily protein [Rhynchospora pubera]